jgi:predicted P-loop ATPase/GTPase
MAGATTFAFELSNGSLDIALGPLGSVTADNVFVQYTNLTTTVTAGTVLTVGPLSYTFDSAIAANTIAFTVEGFEASILDFVTLSGDIGFKKSGSDIIAVGNNVSASLEAGPVYARVTGADFGLMTGATTFAFEVSNGALELALGPLANISADNVFVQYTNLATTVAAGTTVSVGSLSYTFDEAIAANTIAFAVVGLSAGIDNIASLSGDFGFKKQGTDIIAVGQNINVSIGNSNFGVGVTGGSLGLISNAQGLALEASGGVYINGGGFGSATATSVLLGINETGVARSGETLSIGPVSYSFQALPASTGYFGVAITGLDVTIGGGVADVWIRMGRAVAVPTAEPKIETASLEVVAETADRTPKRRKLR